MGEVKGYLNTADACAYLDVTAKTLRRIVRQGKLQQYTIVGKIEKLYKKSELDVLKKVQPVAQEAVNVEEE